ncbi:histone H1-like protein Hc1 [Mucilaginibacter gracilis]|uniref:Histone H1-like protein Hc1 n=1 Tax=Mucilaginibacter gracilis TaxID=423350 RepID=A0A495IV29_9SPHI|nr:histone H1 [Mucilaginibacter gracilis]RKR80432.1 histone H1-like protein Hc1 [Mucilaginibacter gracilis]
MSKFADLKSTVADIESDVTKFYENGNKAAGTRVRNGLQAIKKLAQEIRLEVAELKTKPKGGL